MDQNERTEQEIKKLAGAALWYAWGQIDRDPEFGTLTLGTEHGQEFSRLYEQIARDYKDQKRSSRPSVLDAWREYLVSKHRVGVDTVLSSVDDIDRSVRYSREDAAKAN